MTLSERERLVAIISNAISVFSLLQERGELGQNSTMYDFVLRIVPENVSAELIDEVFECVTSAHSS